MRIALVGAGHMGKIHAQKLTTMPDVEVVGIVDIDGQARKEATEKFSVPAWEDYKTLTGNVDGVVIATPTESHFETAQAFLNANAHVFIEKPITSTPEQAQQLIDIASAKNLVFQVGHLERFNPAFQEALRQVEKPVFIEAQRLSMFTGRSIDIDVVLDLMIHDIDLVLTLVKSGICEVRAHGMPFLIDKLDAASARLVFDNGCVATINASRISIKKERALTIFEKNRYFYVDLLNGKLTVCSKSPSGNLETTEFIAEKMDAVNTELTDFINTIRQGKRPNVHAEDGLKALILANEITRFVAELYPFKAIE